MSEVGSDGLWSMTGASDEFTDLPCRHSTPDFPRGYILGYHGSGGDHRIIADSDTFQHGGVTAYPYEVADVDGLARVAAFAIGYAYGEQSMIVVDDRDVIGDQDILSDADVLPTHQHATAIEEEPGLDVDLSSCAMNEGVMFDPHAIAHGQAASVVKAEVGSTIGEKVVMS